MMKTSTLETVIQIHNLEVRYGGRAALDGLSLEVRRGRIFGFIGPNGAGKTTAIKALLGLIFPSRGTTLVHGLPPDNPRSRARIGYLPEETLYHRFLTPVEILRFYGEVFGIPSRDLNGRIARLLDLTGLASAAHRRVGTLSKGTVQKIGLAQALINDPETLVLDEPMSGLDPLARMDLRKILADLKSQGKTVFFSSHELSEVELVCDEVAIVKAGKTMRSGPLQDVVGSGDRHLERFFLETMGGNAA